MKYILFFFGCVAFIVYCASQWKPLLSTELFIAALDIGQGDSIYIRTPQGTDILIDGGEDRAVIHELGEVMPPYDHTLEFVIATHPDADHIGGLPELTESYTVEHFIMNGDIIKNTAPAEALREWAQHDIETFTAYRGWNVTIEPDVWLEFVHPDPTHPHKETNDDSVMFILHYKEFSAMFTGDASSEVEQELIDAGILQDVDLLKVGHHGSKTSTSTAFLDALHPEGAIISVGEGNKFGHPHAGPLMRLEQRGIQIFRTDLSGRIECRSNGKQYTCE